MANSAFQDSKLLFEHRAEAYIDSSAEYSTFDFRLEQILLLSDRLLAACEGHPLHGRVPSEISKRLSNLVKGFVDRKDSNQAAVDLLAKLEIWLKAILWVACPEKWEKARIKSQLAKDAGKPSRFNLYQAILELGLLSEQEIQTPVERYADISDPVRQLILCAKEDRNPLEHDGSEILPHVQARLLDSALVAFLAPVIRFQKELQCGLRSLVVKPLEFGSLEPLARQIESERRGHLDRFAGRDDWLTTLSEKLCNQFCDEGGYILLTATEGTGKSAIISKLSQQFANTTSILGPHSTQVQKSAPWLPAVILHMGKASNLPSEIVPFLLEQICCQLVSPLADYSGVFSETTANDSIDKQVRRLGAESSLLRATDRITQSDTEDRSFYVGLEWEKSGRGSGFLHARRFLYDSLEKLVAETGQVILLIDALEEISSDGSRLAFLPERLPRGVGCLLTSRPKSAAEEYIRSKLKNVETIELKQLRRDELPLLTNVDDLTPGGREFNDDVMENSSGLPLIVSGIGRLVRKEADFRKVPVQGVRDQHFELKAKEWSDCGRINSEVLGLLAIFEPVMPLELADVQAYLESRGELVEVAELREMLKPVFTQLQGLDISRVKLAMRPFAEYVRELYFSPRDLWAKFKRVVDWLVIDGEVKADVFARLFIVWSDASALNANLSELSSKHREFLAELPSILLERGKHELLLATATRLLRESDEPIKTAIECLRYAAKLGSINAMQTFSILIDDTDEELKLEAVGWVRRGAEAGDPDCMMAIGSRMLDGYGVEQDRTKGLEWLKKSAYLGHSNAMLNLGMHYLQEDALVRDIPSGMSWLRKASDNGSIAACFVLGTQLIHSDSSERELKEGLTHLQAACDANFLPAIRFLSNLFLSGTIIPQDSERGIELLQKAISLDDETATLTLAHRYFAGDGVEKNVEKGIATLESATSKGLAFAKRALGNELLTGDHTPDTDIDRGVCLLEEAANDGDAPSMVILADYLLDETKDGFIRGKALLLKAIELRYDLAVCNLANRFALGEGLPKNPHEGLELLRKYATEDRPMIRLALGLVLVDGSLGENDVDQGIKILDCLCDDGNVSAMRNLGLILLHGDGIPKDIERGIALLNSAISNGDTDAMSTLGRYLLEFGASIDDRNRGLTLLLQAENEGAVEASFELGKLYLEGDKVERDKDRAFQYIRASASGNHPPAMVFLAKECILGTTVEKDEQQAKTLLESVGERNVNLLTRTGFEFYREGHFYWAARCFMTAFKHGDAMAGSNMAYMVRRHQVPQSFDAPSALALVSKGAKEGDGFCLVNQALCFAAGIDTNVDWCKADRIIAMIQKVEDRQNDDEDSEHPFEWWLQLTADPDYSAEGHLVMGWFARHGIAEDPDGMTPAERFQIAREGGWDVPDWYTNADHRESKRKSLD